VQRAAAAPGEVVQPLRLVNIRPTWTETTSYVKANAGSYANIQTTNFGAGAEAAYRCPGCLRWLPVGTATVDHIVPKSYLMSMINLGGIKGDSLVNSKRLSYGLQKDLDWTNVKYRVLSKKGLGWVWTGRKKLKNDLDEPYLENAAVNDLDNLRLMCNSCNSSKGNSNNTNGTNAPPQNTAGPVAKYVDPGDGSSVAISVAPGVSEADSHPSSKFSTAWIKTRRYFLAGKYHAMGAAQHNFGPGAEPAYVCGGCNRTLPIAIATVDHVLAKSNYPHRSLDLTNLQLMCNVCNSSKSNT
jgi:5-methylcytosine-specific restriction endonuclease McrA